MCHLAFQNGKINQRPDRVLIDFFKINVPRLSIEIVFSSEKVKTFVTATIVGSVMSGFVMQNNAMIARFLTSNMSVFT